MLPSLSKLRHLAPIVSCFSPVVRLHCEEDREAFPSCHIPMSLSTSPVHDLERKTLMSLLNLSIDELLTTTRTVRKRLDLTRPVESEVIAECLQLAVQAPSAGMKQNWHFLVITEPAQRKA